METILAEKTASAPGSWTQQEKRALLTQLLSHLAHEIRNPLSALDVHVQLLEEDLVQMSLPSSEKTMERFQIIRTEIRRLENIVRKFLQLTGPSSLHLTEVSLNEIIRHAAGLMEPEAARQGIEMPLELAEEMPILMADKAQLTQAALNLLINALQAVGANGWVVIRTIFEADRIQAVFEDNGPGISREHLPKIFEPYFTTKTDGSGLGLWIAQQIIHAHGGVLRADNGAERGARFVISLPRRGNAN